MTTDEKLDQMLAILQRMEASQEQFKARQEQLEARQIKVKEEVDHIMAHTPPL
jgi:uncharacterized protein YhaN